MPCAQVVRKPAGSYGSDVSPQYEFQLLARPKDPGAALASAGLCMGRQLGCMRVYGAAWHRMAPHGAAWRCMAPHSAAA
jgi:hypothetical protein